MDTFQHRVDELIRNYRIRGHTIAQLDPLGIPREEPPELCPGYYGFTVRNMDRPFSVESISEHALTLRQILSRLRNTYCGFLGVQFMHIDDNQVREWLQERMERTENQIELSRKEQLQILTLLTDAVTFEEFIQKKF